MSLLVLLLLLSGPLLLVVIIAVAVQSPTRQRTSTRREWQQVRAMVAGALVVGVLAAWLVHHSLALGRGTMLVPAVLGLFVVLGVGLAETVVRPRRPAGPRTASLQSRRVADYAPRALVTAVAGTTAVHVATLALTTATASADDLSRAGRSIAAQCGSTGSAAGPYPGAFYSVPLALLIAAIAVVAAAALTAVVRRPRGFAPDDVGDDVLRRRSTSRVLAASGAAVAASQAGVAFFAGTALLRLDCHRAWMDPVGWVLLVSVPAALVLTAWFLARVVAPAPVPAPAQPAGTA